MRSLLLSRNPKLDGYCWNRSISEKYSVKSGYMLLARSKPDSKIEFQNQLPSLNPQKEKKSRKSRPRKNLTTFYSTFYQRQYPSTKGSLRDILETILASQDVDTQRKLLIIWFLHVLQLCNDGPYQRSHRLQRFFLHKISIPI